jgi:hypothetical protein
MFDIEAIRGIHLVVALTCFVGLAAPAKAETVDLQELCRATRDTGVATSVGIEAVRSSFQSKKWQASGGDLQLVLKGATDTDKSRYAVCFGWKPKSTSENTQFILGEITGVLVNNGVVTLSTAVPSAEVMPEPKNGTAREVWIVPLADVRVLVLSADAPKPVADVSTVIGVTNPVSAIVGTIVVVAIVFVVVLVFVQRRISKGSVRTANPVLAMIATKDGYASLSQFQVLLWTFVVGASAIYVMMLSGTLMSITSGTLILLGISGAAAVAAKARAESDAAARATEEAKKRAAGEPTPTPERKVAQAVDDLNAKRAAEAQARTDVEAAQQAARQARAAAAGAAANPGLANAAAAADTAVASAMSLHTAAQAQSVIAAEELARAEKKAEPHVPSWSDLVVSDTQSATEIDITRLQMLVFTVIAAGFVLLTVITNYVIPEIPAGFDVLLGVSNALYVGNKMVSSNN